MPHDRSIGIPSTSTIVALGERDTLAAPAAGDALAAAGAGQPIEPAARYEDLGLLGEGGMGEVRRVRDRDLMRDLALKRLHLRLREDRRQLRQFLWEARVTALLDHPNIVPLHDLGLDDDGAPFFTMKLVRGESLRERIDRSRSRTGDAPGIAPRLRLFLQLCCAIEFAHSRGILHRDLKPENIVVGDHGELHVMDWGIASPLEGAAGAQLVALASEAGIPTPGAISGTPLYMSPEQAAGSTLDERSDVYTLGVLLYELLSLHHPFEGAALPELLTRIVEGRPRPMGEVAPELSPSVVAVVERAMALDPSARYTNVSALREDVEALADGGTPTAEGASLARRVGRFYVRGRNPWMASLRGIDFEILMAGAASLGMGIAALAGGSLAQWSWPLLALSLVAFAVGIRGWRRNHAQRR